MKKSLNKSTVFTIIALAAIGIIIAIIATVFLAQALRTRLSKQLSAVYVPAPAVTKTDPQYVTIPPSSEWLTYKNPYGYELSYPKGEEWNVVDGTEGQMHASNIQYLLVPNRGCPLDLSDCPEILLQISVLKENNWEELISKFAPPLSDVTFNGVPAKRYDTDQNTFGYLVQNGQEILQINFRYTKTMKISKETAESVLATLKFSEIIKY